MKPIIHSKSLLSIILSITIACTSVSLNATTISDISHTETIQAFLDQLQDIQSQALDITQLALRNSTIETRQLEEQINLLGTELEVLNTRIQNYLRTVPSISNQNRHVLLTFNVLNLIKSSLYTLNLLVHATNDIERFRLLDEFFRSRVTALDTLAILEELLQNF
ncbi:MAG: hypothetical protein K0R69_2436 [Clostridia bacterium]|jgi:hypothetical protein|nr:hypothetical protein [Clostridia bacterium]